MSSPESASRPARTADWFGVAAGMFVVGWGSNQFVSLLVAYKTQRGISTATNDGLFGIYALTLVAALLLCGPAADLWGRAKVVRPAVALSIPATVLLMFGTHSVPLLFAGRFAAGVASGAIFAAGTAWVKELSRGAEDSGARRAALALSAGFGLGPLVAGLVAQWAPHPLVLAYVPHLVMAAVALPLVLRVPETLIRPAAASPSPWSKIPPEFDQRDGEARTPGYLARLRVPAVANPRFLRVVVPSAPWVFAAPSVGFAILPSLVSTQLHGYALLFSAGIAALTLGTGIAIQPLARHLDHPGQVSGTLLGLGVTVVGCLIAASAAAFTSPLLVVIAAIPLGAGYGLCLVSGLLETQRIAEPGELAGLTAVYYSLTYVGFALPLLLATLHPVAAYDWMLGGVAVLAAVCLVAVRSGARRTDVQPGRLRSESAAEVR